jgi:hypothetical protein
LGPKCWGLRRKNIAENEEREKYHEVCDSDAGEELLEQAELLKTAGENPLHTLGNEKVSAPTAMSKMVR